MKTIEQLAERLQEKATWIRKEWQEFMEKISQIGVDEEIYAYVGEYPRYGDDPDRRYSHYLVLGEDDLMIDFNFTKSVDLSYRESRDSYLYSWEELSAKDLRNLFRRIPKALEEVKKKMEEKEKKYQEIEILIKNLRGGDR